MQTWTWRTLAVAAAVLVAGAIVFRLARGTQPCIAHAARSMVIGPDTPVVRRLLIKGGVVQDVVAGRRSLLEAAAVFKALDDEGPPCPGWVAAEPPPGVSQEEQCCRNVIVWVQQTAPADRADEVIRVLETELDFRLQQGALRLPEPAAGSIPPPLALE